MARNALGLAASAAILSLVGPYTQHSAFPIGEVARQGSASTVSLIQLASDGRQEPVDWGTKGRSDALRAMQTLLLEVCRTGRSEASFQLQNILPKNAGEALGQQALRAEIEGPCQPRQEDFIIAVVPDPVHTRLAVFFDRLVESVQQALQDEDYQFVRAVLPWDQREHPEPATLQDRLAAQEYAAARAELPGLLAFRRDPRKAAAKLNAGGTASQQGLAAAGSQTYLFVLIVGESPTGGIAKLQFVNAVGWITEVTKNNDHSPALKILGPTFSGSLASLAELLGCAGEKPCYGTSHIFSGSVSKRSAVNRFLDKEGKLDATFASFQEATEVMIERFRVFLAGRGYEDDRIAILSEDETEYGEVGTLGKSAQDADLGKACMRCVPLYFPREISRLRAAYQVKGAVDLGAGSHSAPSELLPLNLEISGADDDTLPAFSKQTPLSQEAVLLGIVSELRKHAVRFIILRATDPIDLLFLSRYLAAAYPQGRIVTLGADALFPREVEDRQLNGVLALSTYALSPAANHQFLNYKEHGERIFPSSVEAGTYNALRSLLATSAAGRPPADPRLKRFVLDGQDLDLYQYGWCDAERGRGAAATSNTPPVSLLALGRDQYWPIAQLRPTKSEAFSTLLPEATAYQFQNDLRYEVFLPVSWKVAELTAVLLGLAFVSALWLSSVRSMTQPFSQLAPAAADARGSLVAAGAFFLECIFLLQLQPFLVDVGPWRLEQAATWVTLSLTVASAVLAAALLDLHHRARLAEYGADEGVCGRTRHWYNAILLFLVTGLLLALWWCTQGPGGEFNVRRFAVLRSIQLTSGLSPTLPMLLMLAAGLWWAYHITAGSALLLDGRRPQLPKGVLCERAIPLAETDDDLVAGCSAGKAGKRRAKPAEGGLNFVVSELISTLPPRYSSVRHYAALIGLCLGVILLLDRGTPLMTLEDHRLELLLSALFLLCGAWIVGTTARLWEIWLRTRRLLVLLDSRPLRDGFKDLEGFSCKTLWRVSLVTTAEFQSLLSRVWEALGRASSTVPGLLAGSMDTAGKDRKAVLDLWKEILALPSDFDIRYGLRNWSNRA
jgi:hypothetical protein